jgi:L-alanine-DL-glutamate epimerase-like enolase superfamily enzyme
MAANLTQQKMQMDENGFIHLPESPGLGITPDLNVMEEYLVDVEIKVNGEVLYTTSQLR